MYAPIYESNNQPSNMITKKTYFYICSSRCFENIFVSVKVSKYFLCSHLGCFSQLPVQSQRQSYYKSYALEKSFLSEKKSLV